MSKRYGRNQKRAARAELAALQEANDALVKEIVSMTRRRLPSVDAEERAFSRYVKEHNKLDYIMAKMGEALAHEFAEKARPHVKTLLSEAAKHNQGSFVSAYVGSCIRDDRNVRELTIEIQPIRYTRYIFEG